MKAARLYRNVALGIKTLLLHKLRSLLTMLGVVFGVGSVVAMLAVGEGASREALDQIRKLGSTNIIITSMKPVEEESRGTFSPFSVSMYGLRYDDQRRAEQSLSTIRRTVPVKLIRKEARLHDRIMDLRVVGTTPDWFDLVRRDVIAGRVVTPRDAERHASVVVLTEYGARRLLATEHSLGEVLRIGGEYYEVIGLVQSESGQGGAIQTPDQEIDAYIPIEVARERYGDLSTIVTSGSMLRESVELHQLIVEVDRTENVESAAAGLERMLKQYHAKNDYRISVPLALLRQAEATKRTFNIVLGSIAAISLLVGGIGIMNIMLASVTERTREIGIRRAIGAKRAQIIGQFLIETIVLSMTGGAFGMALGAAIPWVITAIAGMPTIVTGYSMLLAVGISVTVGLIFGLYPARHAANLDPIEALRHE
ncbi:MAG: Macrolide export ATP-binding/permease protein MacB [Phycisphaerae bacterium]|nr:Macrolide export ATP-binding/permease protein MacB [Phycisphaerae bacterium]